MAPPGRRTNSLLKLLVALGAFDRKEKVGTTIMMVVVAMVMTMNMITIFMMTMPRAKAMMAIMAMVTMMTMMAVSPGVTYVGANHF